jgi:hypothetical protein
VVVVVVMMVVVVPNKRSIKPSDWVTFVWFYVD